MQNVHLRRAYEVQKKHICDKNRQEGGAREKLLYHGTTQDSCDSIMKTGFNRRFAGQNGKDPRDQVAVISGHCFNSEGSAKILQQPHLQTVAAYVTVTSFSEQITVVASVSESTTSYVVEKFSDFFVIGV